MKWSSAVSDNPSLVEAVRECVAMLGDELGDLSRDLTVVFVSAHHAPVYGRVPELVREHCGDGLLVGCSSGGVIGAGREVENRPGFAIASANLPDVEIAPFHLTGDDLPNADAPPDSWEALVDVAPAGKPQFILLADPFSSRTDDLVVGLDYAFPGSVKIGGIASGATQPGGNALYLGHQLFDNGVVGVAMSGALAVDTVVAQGCRPIGWPLQVTSCTKNILEEVDGSAPFEVLRQIYAKSNERDQQLFRQSLFIGVAMDEFNDSPQLGDFKIRNIIGVNEKTGIVAVDEALREGQTVQFHLRDKETASQDLNALLSRYSGENTVEDGSGALLFSCLGRGLGLYGRPDHDTDMFRDVVRPMPLTGFFCNGEIGPVGDTTFLHGYTSSFGIFRPKRD